MYKPTREYAIIGNLRSAALVSRDGSVDWAPAPYLNSPSVFAALLDEKKGGRWSIAPRKSYTVQQEYLGDTNILITRFLGKWGIVEVTDFIPVRTGNGLTEDLEKAEIHRKVRCLKGACELEIEFSPRFDYARGKTKLSAVPEGILAEHENGRKGVLVSKAKYTIKDNKARSVVTLREGEVLYTAFHYHDLHTEDLGESHYEQELRETESFWKDWVHRCDLATCPIAGPWHGIVVRSSLILKILFFEPPGSIAAAATTSLPEAIGGTRNWDYRFSWIRDSAFTLQALFWMGYVKEARDYVSWLLKECCSVENFDPQNLQIMYGLNEERDLHEEILPHLEGYRKSKPVRIGNDAYLQKQLDVYGNVLDTVWRIHILDSEYQVSETAWIILRGLANHVMKVWKEPDEGLWEVRGGKQHFVYSKLMCWVALDRAVKIAKDYNFQGEIQAWEQEKEAIRKTIFEKGWSERKQSFVQRFGSEDLDTSLLLMPTVGFIEGDDPRMLSTIAQIEKELSFKNGLLLRYNSQDGLPGREGAFIPASFWLIDALIFAGKKEKAKKRFLYMLRLANHVGLFSEEINPKTLDFLGNFPQAYSHIGLINSAFYLALKGKVV